MADAVRLPLQLVTVAALLLAACGDGRSASPSAIVTATRGPQVAATVAAPTATPAAELPSQILDLADWKLQLPISAAGDVTGRFVEILQPQLARYLAAPYFQVRSDAVQFRAPVNGLTTSGSMYPRSELREMTGGARQASWSTTAGVHTMTVEQAITALPAVKRHIVAGQIHDGSDDVLTIRLENSKLFVDHGGVDGPTLTTSYTLGTRFTITMEASDGQIRIYYNNSPTPIDVYAKAGDTMYFKAGSYVQSNCQREAVCAPTNYGEVLLYKLSVSHR